MSRISDFTDAGRQVIESALGARYGRRIEIEPADSELKADIPGSARWA